MASVRVINIPVLDLRRYEDDVARAATAAASLAVREDGSGAITLGCSGLSCEVPRMVESLKAEGLNVPVINPYAAAVKLTKSLVDTKVSFRKITYPNPPEKKVISSEA